MTTTPTAHKNSAATPAELLVLREYFAILVMANKTPYLDAHLTHSVPLTAVMLPLICVLPLTAG